MKLPLFLLLTTTTTSAATAQLLLPQLYSQTHINRMSTTKDTPTGPPLLSDVLPQSPQISIFTSMARSIGSISSRLSDTTQNTTILAPSNEAVSKLPRKPWEDPEDGGGGGDVLSGVYKGLAGEDRAGRNLRRFVEAHCVGASPWVRGLEGKVGTLEGKEVWWDEVEGVRMIFPDKIEVQLIKDEVSNGQIWILKGVVNY